MSRSIHLKAIYAAFSVILAVGASSQASAGEPAFVSKVGGKGVTLSRGQEKLPVQVQTLLSRGDRVTAANGSFVEVTYLEDGCILKVANGRSITISGASPCAAAEAPKSAEETQALKAPDQPNSKIEPAAADGVPVEVTQVEGPLARANLGAGLVDINVGQMLKEGDTVFAGQSSRITLYFVDPKCYYTVEPETFLKITSDPPCREEAVFPPEGDNVAGLVLLGAGAGGVGLAICLMGPCADDDDDKGTPVTGQ